ncbi:hypothetical protein D1872_277800 [compost metagenome]
MDDQSINVRNIDTCLYNARTDKHIIFPIQKVQNGPLKLLLGHLSMPYANACIRYKHGDLCSHFLDSLHPIVQVIDLSAPSHFPFDRFSDKCLAVFYHIGLYRKTILRGGLNY